MDMVFGDSGDLAGGFYDSNAGVDYHVPVSGSSARPPRLRIAHVSVEMAPIAKVGTGRALRHAGCHNTATLSFLSSQMELLSALENLRPVQWRTAWCHAQHVTC